MRHGKDELDLQHSNDSDAEERANTYMSFSSAPDGVERRPGDLQPDGTTTGNGDSVERVYLDAADCDTLSVNS